MYNRQLVRSDHILARKIKEENILSIEQVKEKLVKIIESNKSNEEKFSTIASLFFEQQDKTDPHLSSNLF